MKIIVQEKITFKFRYNLNNTHTQYYELDYVAKLTFQNIGPWSY